MADGDTKLAITIEANTKSMENALKRLESTVSKSMAAQTRSVKSLDNQLRSMGATALKAASALGIAFSTRALVSFVKSNIEAGAAVGDLAAKLQISAEATQELTFAADQSGASVEALAPAFKAMAALVTDAERGTKAAKQQLAELGLTLDDIRGKAPDKLFELFATQIGKIQDPIQRTNELVQVFGKSGGDLAQLATAGATGIEALRQKARALGIVLDNETIARAKEAGDKLDLLGAAGQAAGIKLATEFIPAIDALEKLITDPKFQQGLQTTAGWLSKIIEIIAAHPEVLPALAGAAAGFLVGGPAGAVVGAAVGQGSSLIGGAQAGAAAAGANAQKVTVQHADGTTETISIDEFNRRKNLNDGSIGGGALRAPGSAPRFPRVADTGTAPPGPIDQTASAERLKRAIEDINNQLEQSIALSKRWNDALMDVGGAAFDVFAGILDGTKDAKTAILDFLKQLALAEAKAAFLHLLNPNSALGPIATLLGGQFPGLPGRAGGGPVMAGHPYIVGENRRPELFVPNTSGRIMPNMGLGGGGAPIINIINSGGGRVNQQQRTVGGRSIIDIVIDAVKGDMAQGGFDEAMQGRYGGRALTRRIGV